MGSTIAQKLIKSHLLSGDMTVGSEIGLRIDQTLTQDATGTMAYLEFEAMGVERVKTELSVAYIDHNTLQTGFENADDHRFIRSAAKKRGLLFSRPGNGICHQVHLERFGIPGTPRPAAASACSRSAQADSTSQLQWAAAHTT